MDAVTYTLSLVILIFQDSKTAEHAAHIAGVLTLIVLAATLIPIWLSTRRQKKLFAAQFLRDRWEMFLDAWDVQDKEILRLKEKPYLYIDPSLYERHYKGNDDRIRDFLVIVNLYEYLAFTYTLVTSKKYLGTSLAGQCWAWFWLHLKIGINGLVFGQEYREDGYGDLGYSLVRKFVKDLVKTWEDKDFPHVHESYKTEYPDFYDFVEKVKKENLGPPIPK